MTDGRAGTMSAAFPTSPLAVPCENAIRNLMKYSSLVVVCSLLALCAPLLRSREKDAGPAGTE